ncbi:cyclopropane fatty acyl phospholipid synthase [Candidatus Parcubacteria bacterium]|nr:cyclopropane fatty acyl phospholipid synthase [Candidatus Parcubacteria bacterium]
MPFFKEKVQTILNGIGVEIGGPKPSDIQVHTEKLYARVLLRGSIGLGEAYVDKWWDCQSLDQFFTKLLSHGVHRIHRVPGTDIFHFLYNTVFNRQSVARSFEVGERHYDLGNDLYRAMLDKRMVYSCGYWKDARTLDEAQEAKLDLICRKLRLKAGQHVLDIGCGWGSFAKFAAEKYEVKVTGVTISKEQAVLAKELTAGLPVEILLQDYRTLKEQFDHVVSIGMFEHVGHKNYRTFMKVVNKCLKKDGLFLLHTIGGNFSGINVDPWIDKYIFPNGILPALKHISSAVEGLFVMEDWHNFGADYDKTLMAWHTNFERAWPQLRGKYSERFKRMWDYYLLSCAASFRSRDNQLWQIVLSKKGIPGGYQAVR